MATNQEIHYVFNRQTSDASIQDATPIDVVFPALTTPTGGGEFFNTPMEGGFIVRIPSGLDFNTQRPGSASESIRMASIQTEKSTALLAKFPGFTRIVFDDMLDATGFNASTGSGCVLGGRNGVKLMDRGTVTGRIPATVSTVASSLLSTPTQAVIYFEGFLEVPNETHTGSYTDTGYPGNPNNGQMSMAFRPITSDLVSSLVVDVSFNGGSTYITNVFSEDLVNIDPADQGSSLIVRFTKAGSASVYPVGISGWAVIY